MYEYIGMVRLMSGHFNSYFKHICFVEWIDNNNIIITGYHRIGYIDRGKQTEHTCNQTSNGFNSTTLQLCFVINPEHRIGIETTLFTKSLKI